MAFLKVEFSTVRELENKVAHIFKYGGGAFLAGIALIFVFPPVGIIVTALSAVVVLGSILYVSILGKERSRKIFCPHCASMNEVYVSRREFNCDMCHRQVKVDEGGEVIMAQPIDLFTRQSQSAEED